MRLIDADALMNASYTLQGGTEEYHFGFDDGYRYFQREVVGDAPTIDAVPVVRCRECAFWGLEPKEGRAEAMCLDLMRTTASGFYCAHGQRREEGDA